MALSCACVRRWVPFWTGHDAMAEYGNLVGDVFWTLEPAVCLWLPKLLLRPRRDRTPPPKTKAEAPSPSLLRTRTVMARGEGQAAGAGPGAAEVG